MAADALPNTKRVQIIDWKKFVKAALDPNKEVFVVHIVTINLKMAIHPTRQAWIVSLKAEEAPVTVPEKYSDYTNVFSEKLVTVLSKYTKINTHSINLEKSKQPPYGPIYNLGPVKLETLKTYIKTNLANGFIRPFKSPASAPILFDQKPDGNL